MMTNPKTNPPIIETKTQQPKDFQEKSLKNPRLHDNTPVYQTQITNLYPLFESPDTNNPDKNSTKFPHYCEPCKTDCTSAEGYESHKKTFAHTGKVDELKKIGNHLGGKKPSSRDSSSKRTCNTTALDSGESESTSLKEESSLYSMNRKKRKIQSGKMDTDELSNPNLVPLGNRTVHNDSLPAETVYCELCTISFKNLMQYEIHLKSYMHKKNLEIKRKQGEKVNEKMEPSIPFAGDKNSFSRGIKPPSVSFAVKKSTTDEFTNKNHHFCEICNVNCSSEVVYKAHINGARHYKNAKTKEKAEADKVFENNESKIMIELRKTNEPLLGLEYVTEFQREDGQGNPRYFCNLCKFKLETSSVISHIIGNKHRLFYLKQHFHYQYDLVNNLQVRGKELNQEITYQASQIEKKYGRQSVCVEIESGYDKSTTSGTKAIPESLNDRLSKSDDSIIGLEHITEYQFEGDPSFEPFYYCDLCSIRGSTNSMLLHISGVKHRLNYAKINSPKEFNDITSKNLKGSALTQEVAWLAFEIERKSGRHEINYAKAADFKIRKDITEAEIDKELTSSIKLDNELKGPVEVGNDFVEKMASPIAEFSIQSEPVIKPREPILDSPVAPPPHFLPPNSPPQQLQYPHHLPQQQPPPRNHISPPELNKLLNFVVHNEEDAEIALQISNAMTNALLKYRLDNMPINLFCEDLKFVQQMVNKDCRGPSNCTENVSMPNTLTPRGMPSLDNSQLYRPSSMPSVSLDLPAKFPYSVL